MAKMNIGAAWLGLVEELEEQLQHSDGSATVRPWIDASGLLRLEVRTEPGRRAGARAVARRYEAKAAQTCEQCGSEITRTCAGAIVMFLCVDCAERPSV
jgi:hypothetical protein